MPRVTLVPATALRQRSPSRVLGVGTRRVFIGVAVLLFAIVSFVRPIDLTGMPWASALLALAGLIVIVVGLQELVSGAQGRRGRARSRDARD